MLVVPPPVGAIVVAVNSTLEALAATYSNALEAVVIVLPSTSATPEVSTV